MLLYELLSGLEYKLFGIDGESDITRPFSDSRLTVFGGLFICIRGTLTDGHLYIDEAKRKGARAAVTDCDCSGIPYIKVEDTRYAAAVIWNNFYKRPAVKMRLFGITGTNGKTSTAQFLSACLSQGGRKVGTVGTLGAFVDGERIENAGCEKSGTAASMTTPDPEYLYGVLAEFRHRGVTDAVLEVSSHSVLQRKVDALNFKYGIFTNLSPEHLDFHSSMEEYFSVKASFVARCMTRIVNGDDPYGSRFCEKVPALRVGKAYLRDISVLAQGVSYSFDMDGERFSIKSQVGGDFTVYNTLLAAVCAHTAGVGRESIERAIGGVSAVSGRLERVVRLEESGFDLYIDYAHTPAALESVLTHLRRVTKGRLICVFGCGGERDRKKRPLMGRCAEYLSDAVIVTSDNPRGEDAMGVIRDIIEGMTGKNSVVIPARREAIYAAVSMAVEGDTVLLAGKGHETYEIGAFGKVAFDEREAVKEALRLKNGN